MIRKRMYVALALAGFVGAVLKGAVAPLPTAAHNAQELPLTPSSNVGLPDRVGARGFDPAAIAPYSLDLRAESLLDN